MKHLNWLIIVLVVAVMPVWSSADQPGAYWRAQPTGQPAGQAPQPRTVIAWTDAHAKQMTARFLDAHQAHRDAVASLQQCQNCHGGPSESWVQHLSAVALQPKGPWIGISVGPADAVLRSQLRLPEGAGVVVTQVVPEGPAQQAGIETDDVLLSVNGKPVASGEDLDKVLGAAGKDGTPLTLKLLHEGRAVEKQVTPRKEDYLTFISAALGERPVYRIGVEVNEPDATLRRQLKLGDAGVVVAAVYPGKPAEAAGIKAGDVLLSAGGKRLANQDELTEAVQRAAASPLELELMRGGVTLKITVTPVKETAPMSAPATMNYVNLLPKSGELLLVRPTELIVGSSLDAPATGAATEPAQDQRGDRMEAMAEEIRQLRAAVDALRADLGAGKGPGAGAE